MNNNEWIEFEFDKAVRISSISVQVSFTRVCENMLTKITHKMSVWHAILRHFKGLPKVAFGSHGSPSERDFPYLKIQLRVRPFLIKNL